MGSQTGEPSRTRPRGSTGKEPPPGTKNLGLPLMAAKRGLVAAIALACLAIVWWPGSQARADPDPGQPVALTLAAGSEIDYHPFCFVDQTGQPSGFSVELLQQSLKAMGRSVTFRTGLWAEVRGWLERGEVQVLPLVGRTPEREGIYDFTFPYMTLHGAIVVREGTRNIHSLEDLKGKRVAVMRGDNAEEFLRREDRGLEIVTTPTFVDALRELADGRHDAVVIQRLVALRLLQEHHLTGLKVLDRPVESFRQDFCFAVRDGDRDTLALLNEGLALVLADGTFRRLHARWFAALELPSNRVVVGGDHAYPPWEFLDENGRPTGFNVDLAREVAREVGLEVTFRLGPWPSVVKQLETGDIDVLAGMFFSAERCRTFDFSPPHSVNHCVAVGRRGAGPLPEIPADLAGRRLVVQRGDIMHEFAVGQGLASMVTAVDTQEEALREVAKGRQDLALVGRTTALYWIGRNGWSHLEVGRRSLLTAEYCFAFAKGRRALVSQFSEGLQSLEKSGEYRKIQEKWLGVYDETTLSSPAALRRIAAAGLALFVLLAATLTWSWSLRRQVTARTADLQNREIDLRRRLATERVLSQVAALAVKIENLPEFLTSCAEALGTTLEASRVFIFQAEDQTGAFLESAAWDESGRPKDPEPGSRFPMERFPWWREQLSAEAGLIRCEDVTGLPDPDVRSFLEETGTRAILAAPITAGSTLAGFIGLAEAGRPRAWPDPDVTMVQAIARIIGGVFERHRQAKALANNAQQQAAIAELGGMALEGGNLNPLLEQAVRRVAQVLHVEMAKILELLPDRSGLLLKAGVGWHEGLVGKAVVGADLNSQAGFTLQEKDPVIVEDLRTETRFTGPPLLFEHGVVSGLSVIIGNPERPYGVFGVHTIQRRRFTLHEVNFLQGVAHLLANAVQRQAVEAELRESRGFLADLIEHSGALIFAKDRSGRYLLANRRWEEATGIPRHHTLGQTDEHLFPPEVARQFQRHDQEVMESGQAREVEESLEGSQGPRHFLSVKFPMRNNAGEVTGVCGMATEITERRRAIESLQHSEERLRTLIEGAPDAIMVQTNETFAFLNPQALRLFGADDPTRLLGTPVTDRFHPAFRDQVRARIRSLNENRLAVPLAEEIILRLDGTPVPVEVSAVPFQYGEENGALVFLRDITERKRAEEDRERIMTQLSQATKMESIGRLAGGVAHDFNNMLGVILGRADMALDSLPPDSPLREDLQEIRQAATHSADLTRQLLAFARKQAVFPRVLDLNDTIGNMLKMLRRLIGEDIELRWEPGADLWPVRIDPGQVDQVLANLCVNARDAITGTGAITIRTARAVIGPAEAAAQADLTPGEYVEICVTDTGAGMDQATLAHLFEPFFTTKQVGRGTGLGLATIYGIIRQNEGFITVDSQPGAGSTFRILLPRHQKPVATPTPELAPPATRTGGETVLLVEDEMPLLALIRKMLTGLGYQVLAAQTPAEALHLARSHRDRIDLLLTDVVMPEMNGRDLAKQLLALHPNLRRVFMSGYTADVIARQGVLEEGMFFLQKPFTPKELAAKIRSALDAPSP